MRDRLKFAGVCVLFVVLMFVAAVMIQYGLNNALEKHYAQCALDGVDAAKAGIPMDANPYTGKGASCWLKGYALEMSRQDAEQLLEEIEEE